jgi:hypothetical protein
MFAVCGPGKSDAEGTFPGEKRTMTPSLLTYAASVVVIGWGMAHLFPTKSIVRGFGDISDDNRRTITMEWINEGIALVFLGVLVGMTTYLDGASLLAKAVYASAIVALNVLSLVSLFTGFRNSFIAFKLCPFIFTGSSVLIAVGSQVI